jgi:aryl-alcohol dehydrogenase-like predicted oxidoreductase
MKRKRRALLLAAAGALAPAYAQRATLLRKKIPASGEEIPVVGLGTARRYERPEPGQRETLARFVALGGTVIDTAPVYGEAETVLGDLLQPMGMRNQVFLATKVSITGREAGARQIEGSFKRLRTGTLDLVAVHNLRDTAVHLPVLRELRKEGRIRYVGITTSFDRQYADFEQTMRRESLDWIQVDYALDNRGAGERILPLAADRGMAVMVNLPFGRGRLFETVRGKALPSWAAEFDCASWPQFFLKYIVSHPAVTCAVPGMARPDYVDDNLGAARGRLPDAALRRRMEALIDAI